MTQRAIDGDYFYFVTANVQDRRWFFVSSERVETLGQTTQTCCRMKNFDLLAYCILPNHVHLLVRKRGQEGVDKTGSADRPQRMLGSMRCLEKEDSKESTPQLLSNRPVFLFSHRRLPSRRSLQAGPCFTLSQLMHSIKSTYSQSLRQGKFWQHRSHFRIIDNEEYLSTVVEYIQGNYKKMHLPELYGKAPFVFIDQCALDRIFEQ